MRVFQTLLAFSGNAQPQLALTRELVKRGHRVRVLAHTAARERIESTGAELVPFRRVQPQLDLTRPEYDSLRDWQARTRLGSGLRLIRNGLFAFVVEVSRECAQELASWSADVVVFDWMLSGAAVAAQGAGVPAVAIVHCPYPLPVKGAPPLLTGLRPMAGRIGAVRDGLLGAATTRLLARGLPLVNRARAEQGLQPLRRFEDQLLGARAIYVMSAPELDFAAGGQLPKNVHYVGPAFEPYPSDWRAPWSESNSDPLVVVSLSTSYMDQLALAQRILDALSGLPLRVLLTAGPALDAASLRLPSNTRAVAFVPHRSVFPQAALVISHAGWQTINAALADGVPLLCIPDGRDQPDNALRVQSAGAGICVSKRISPRKLRRTVVEALQSSTLRQGAAKAAAALARSDGALRAADELERIEGSGA